MMQRNVFFKVRLLIPLCLWCVRFRHNNHLVRKKNTFWLKIPNCYGLPVQNIQFLTPWARLETVLSVLANVELQTLYLSHHPLRLLIQTGLFFFNFHLQLWLFVYANWKMCGNTSRWQCTDSNCAVDRTASVRMDHTELSLLRHYFALTVWNESRSLNL